MSGEIAEGDAFSVDAFLGGRVEAVQPRAGHHRSGLDAVLIAAAFADGARGRAVDLGAGAGVAGFCLAARAPAVDVVLAEREADLVDAARRALERPANAPFRGRAHPVAADILTAAGRQQAGLSPASFDIALMNPPFYEAAAVRSSPRGRRAAAHVLAEGGLDGWFRAAAALIAPSGILAAILPAARLGDLIEALDGRFGAVHLLPVHPRADAPALRVVVRATKGSRAPLAIQPGLVLHEAGGNGFSAPLRAILRDGAALCDVHPWPA